MSMIEPEAGLGRVAREAKSQAAMAESAIQIMEVLQRKGRRPYFSEPEYRKLAYYKKLWDQNTPVPNEVKELLDLAATLPKPTQVAHARRLAEYRQFVVENHRIPSTGRPAKEASLARWADKMKREGTHNNPEVRNALLSLIADTKEQTWGN